MGQSLQEPQVRRQLDELHAESIRAGEQLEDAMAGAALDLVGVFDPTPVSDCLGALRSAAQGDWVGAALSVVSAVPYAGDMIGKTAKGARVARRISALRKMLADNAVKAKQISMDALKRDAVKIRAQRQARKAEKIEDSMVSGCPIGGNRFGTQSPKNGWKSERGNSDWQPRDSGLNQENVDEIESITDGKPVKFKEGYPDFSEYVHAETSAAGQSVRAEVEVELSRVGNREQDFRSARDAMADKLGVSEYREPQGYTWHHSEDGTTMQLIPSELHNNVPHSGGVSMAKDPMY